MSKQGGMGDNCYCDQYNLSGDVGSLGQIGGGPALLEMPGIDKSAQERKGGERNGTIEFSSWFNDGTGQEHTALKGRPITDRIVSYFRGTTLGNPAASLTAKQGNYDFTRGNDGSLTLQIQAMANGYGLEWGRNLTAGVRTDTSATNGSSIDTTASLSLGGQAYLHVFSFSGTDVTIKIQDSADNAAFADVAGFGFTAVTGVTNERIQLGPTATIRRYVRVITTTSGGFTSVAFAVNMIKNEVAVTF